MKRAAYITSALMLVLTWSPCLQAADFKSSMAQGAKALQRGQVAAAEAAFSAAIKASKRDARPYYQRGVCRERLGRIGPAVADYRKALKLDPKLPQAHNNLGALLHEQLGKAREALPHLQKATALKRDYGEAWYNLGLVQFSLGRNRAAVKSYQKAAKLQPRDADVRINLGGALHRLGDVAGATRQLKIAVKLAPKDALARASFGWLLAEGGKVDAGIVELKRAVRIDPKYLRGWEQLTRMLVRHRRFSDAVSIVKLAQRAMPRRAELHCLLGKVYRKRGMIAAAVTAYQSCVRKDAKQLKAYLLIGLARTAEGNCKAAAKAFNRWARGRPPALKKVAGLLKRCREGAATVVRGDPRKKVYTLRSKRCRGCTVSFGSAKEAEAAGYRRGGAR